MHPVFCCVHSVLPTFATVLPTIKNKLLFVFKGKAMQKKARKLLLKKGISKNVIKTKITKS